ncbi:hypothetical protein FOA52_008530 [Chlamydomonas sp. UWO 241]|nr:hypothetical protein FOA52_008530 [Chlamydomonas sp. UWO 241]
MRPAVDAMPEARARVPAAGWLRLVDATAMSAICCCACWAFIHHRTADALALCVASGAVVALSLSPRFPLEVRCLIPGAWCSGALLLVYCAELAWSRLITGAFVLTPAPILTEFLAQGGSKLVVMALCSTAYKIVAIVLCTELGPSRRALSVCQALTGVASCLLLNAMIETQRAFADIGCPIDAALRAGLAVVAAAECGALLLLLLTPKVAPAGAGAGKAASVSKEQPTWPAAARAQASADTRTPASSRTATAAAAHSRAGTVVVLPTAAASDSSEVHYTSILMTHSVPFTVKFPSRHLADHPHLATPEGVTALRARVERTLSVKASLLIGAPVTLRLVTLTVAAGCIVVNGRVRVGGGVVDAALAEMVQSVLVSDLLLALTSEGEQPERNGDTAVLQLGDDAPPLEMAFIAARAAWRAPRGRFLEGPARLAQPLPLPDVPLLSATWPLLALPYGESSLVHLQLRTARLARELGNDPELVVSWAPSGSARPAPPTPLFRARVATLQSAARSRGNPPGLIDIDVDLGPSPSHGVLIASLVDGDALLAVRSLPVLLASHHAVVAEVMCARLPVDTLHAMAHDLGVLLCGPRVRTPDEALVLRSVVLALMAAESAGRPALPALRALVRGFLHDLDDTEAEASPSSSSRAATATAAGAAARRPPLLWTAFIAIFCALKAIYFAVHGSGAAAMAICLHGLPYAIALPDAAAARAWLVRHLPRALRTVDRSVALRVYTTILMLATIGATGDTAFWTASVEYGGDLVLLLGWAAFDRPRSPMLGAAISLLAELPAMCAFRWYSHAMCGQPMSMGQLLTAYGMRAAALVAVHTAMWRAGARAVRTTKVKVA